ncbi:ImmA/IrrE family metallo-endopeptidase [Streptomyces bohaiensis]|uniref:ImmA/IrrE family metallo-endopeptidase n=1 Tax=Streptomyces bohaiensis TaxID=1431344 RepID=A0ABX1CB85_9ACTN|nr:ImmA/IrrE family metallo-endopeptidase [Streptomyces bohaiensis]NJQ14497.1 ImmA/IrrE family metallo-endopeptidase [Streptomyces bohaiensis]
MTDVTVTNWQMRAGSPSEFAFGVSFLPNPHGDEDRATAEMAASWGSFTLWAGGENLCAHLEQGEVVEAAHWYLLPFLEWLTLCWDALLHEERLPLRNSGDSAAEALAVSRTPPPSLSETDEFAWLDRWTGWWARHSVRAAREGGLFPDIHLRRYRSSLEVSTGAERLVGVPESFAFLTPHRRYEIEVRQAAEALYSVLTAAVAELARRVPDSGRVAALVRAVRDLSVADRRPQRMAWLAGLGEDTARYRSLAAAVDEVLDGVDERARQDIVGSDRATALVVGGSAYARLLYGAQSPSTTREDAVALTSALVRNHVDDASPWLDRLPSAHDLGEVGELRAGEQGGVFGEEACELLVTDRDATWVDVHAVLGVLGVARAEIALSDPDVRAVSVFGPTQRPTVYTNVSTRWGRSPEVERFTLAHELAHLILDRDRGCEVAVASGPWAPRAVEQRANAFAAAFLMPTRLLRHHLATAPGPARELDTVAHVASQLRVSVSSLIDRLFNLGEFDHEEWGRLRHRWRSAPADGG